MKIVTTAVELAAATGRETRQTSLGLVPTMGSLHEGHLSLIRMASAECETVVVSIFVNPTQFDQTRDLESYPRHFERDAELAREAGADLIFAPSAAAMYPDGYETWIELTATTQGMEGAMRSGHFRGVATVCLKLFNLVGPDNVYFGLKDAQQTAVVGAMIRDLNVPVTLRLGPTVRDDAGLALSSRNANLSTEERGRAAILPRALSAGVSAGRAGDDAAEAALALLASAAEIETDYVEEMSAHGHRLLCGAIRVGAVRLIDNMILEVPA